MIYSDFIGRLSARFNTDKHGWKSLACKTLNISRPSLDRYIALDSDGMTSKIPDDIWKILDADPIDEEKETLDSPYTMVNLLAEGLCALQECIDRVGHIQAPYPQSLSRGLNIASALNLEHGSKYPTNLAGLLKASGNPLFTWCQEYEGPGAEEFGAALLIKDGEITPECLAIAGLGDIDPELHFYRSLMSACGELDEVSAQKFYVAWRRAVIEHPIADGFTIFLTDPVLRGNLSLTQELAEIFYEPLSVIHAEKNMIPVCPVSGTRLRKIRGEWVSECRDPKASIAIRQDGPSLRLFLPGMLELKRPARIFWALPGLQEIDLFNAAHGLGYHVELWPRMDAVDLIITHPEKPVRFAVDLKEYRSPIGLARSFDGFKFYKRHQQVIVIPDYLSELNPDYIQHFERARRAKLKTKIQIMTYSELLHLLEINQ